MNVRKWAKVAGALTLYYIGGVNVFSTTPYNFGNPSGDKVESRGVTYVYEGSRWQPGWPLRSNHNVMLGDRRNGYDWNYVFCDQEGRKSLVDLTPKDLEANGLALENVRVGGTWYDRSEISDSIEGRRIAAIFEDCDARYRDALKQLLTDRKMASDNALKVAAPEAALTK